MHRTVRLTLLAGVTVAATALVAVPAYADDTVAPVVDAYALTAPTGGATVGPGDTVTMSYTVHDDVAVTQVQFRFSDPTGARHDLTLGDGNTAVPDSGTISTTVDGASWPDGTYRLTEVSARDLANNRTTPTPIDTEFTVAGSPDDVTVPTLDSVSLTGGPTLAPGDSFGIPYAFTDQSDLASVSAVLTGPDGPVTGPSTTSPARSGTLAGTVGGDWAPGHYTLTTLSASDGRNGVQYFADNTYDVANQSLGPVHAPPSLAPVAFDVAAAPAAPTAVAAVAHDRSATVHWTAPAANGSPITSYRVTAAPGGRAVTTSGTSTTVTGLTDGVRYAFTVTATNAVGTSPASAASAAVVPAGKPGLIGKPTVKLNGHQATITWKPHATNGAPITGYTVRVTGTAKRTVKVKATRLVLKNLKPGTYKVTVGATNRVGSSAPGTAASFTVKM